MSASALVAARLSPVTTESRGKAIERRMHELGLGPTEMAKEADVSRALVYRALGDQEGVSAKSYGRMERALERLESELTGGPDAVLSTEDGLVEFEVTGDFGVKVVVKGPIRNLEEVEASVARLIRDIRERPTAE